MKKKKNKRKSYAPGMDAHAKAVIEEAIRIRTRMRIRDLEGNERIFRSTVAEDQESAEDPVADQEDEEDSG